MDKGSLLERRTQAETQFDTLAKQKEQKEQEIQEIDTELHRLQGEYRLLNDLITKEESAVSPSAEVIDVDSAVKGKKNG